jgi:hypothetical protein
VVEIVVKTGKVFFSTSLRTFEAYRSGPGYFSRTTFCLSCGVSAAR